MNQRIMENVKPLSVRKQISFMLVACVALFSTIVVVGNGRPSEVVAQTTPATEAAVILDWSTSNSGTGANATNAIYTIQYDAINCDDVIGGTAHKQILSTAQDAVLGTNSSDTTILPTHLNLNLTQVGGFAAEPCVYDLKVTSNLPCTFTVDLNSNAGTSIATSAPVLSNTVISPTTATVRIGGKITSSDTFFTTRVSALGDASAGNLVYYNSSNAQVDVSLTQNTVALVIDTITCNIPAVGQGFTLGNAEPAGSAGLIANVAPRGGCVPRIGGNSGEIGINSGTQATSKSIIVDATCTYNFSVSQATTSSIGAIRSQCTVLAVIYEREGTSTTLTTRIIRNSDDPVILQISQSTFRVFLATSPTLNIVHMTLLLSDVCPRTKTVKVQYEVVDLTDPALRISGVGVRIAAAAGSSAACTAIPSTVSLTAATTATVDNSVSVTLVERPVLGRTCSYTFSYPVSAGALTLAAEPGNNFKAGTGISTTIARPSSGAITHTDAALDGSVTYNVRLLTANTPVSVIYEARKLPITISTYFPEDSEFTTAEQVTYSIMLTGKCARYSELVARALGGEGTFRTVQAYQGKTLVYGPSLRDLVSPTSQAGDSLVDVTPIVVENGVSFPCQVLVSEVGTPTGCTILGDPVRIVTFAEGLAGFDFNFEHACAGRSGTPASGTRSITG